MDAQDRGTEMTKVGFRARSFRSIGASGLLRRLTIALALAPRLFALNPNLSIGQYLHTSWTQEEGSALPPIQAVAQTADGYLWLGTGTGLIRFDGMRFVEWAPPRETPLPSVDIRCLRAASQGGLWIGTTAGLCRLDHGRILRYPSLDSLPCRVIGRILEDAKRGVWIVNVCSTGTTLGLLSADGQLRTFGKQDGLPDQAIRTLFQDREANLWIGTTNGICRWSPGHAAVCAQGPPVDAVSIVDAGDSDLLIADHKMKREVRLSGGQMRALAPSVPDSSFMPGAMVRDRGGSTWLGTTGEGLLRFYKGAVERFTLKDGLSSNLVTGLLEDREGDLWVATARGLDRFRDPKVVHLSTLDGLSGDLIDAVFGARDGAMWIGTAGGGLDRFADRRVIRYSIESGLPSASVASLYEDAAQRLWVGTSAGLAVQEGQRFVEVLTAGGRHLDRVFNITGNAAGGVWLADSKQGLFIVRGHVAAPAAVADLEARDIYRLLVAPDGTVWIGHFRGGVSMLRDQSVKRFDTRDGLAGGTVQALYQDREGSVWAGTTEGLSRFRDRHWTTWTTAQGLPEGGVQSMIEDNAGALWLMTSAGVLRLAPASLKGLVKSLSYDLYGRTEGLRFLSRGAMTTPRFSGDRTGRLWFCTEDGVAIIDPASVRPNPVPPSVVIEQVMLDGQTMDASAYGELPIRGHDLQISYTGISLMVPERVRFRYRMYDLDRDWTDAGGRRNVAYINLPPGHYRFQVIASNSDGVWNSTGAELALRVDPYFYQTKWFALTGLTAALLFGWSLHKLRMRRLVSRFRLIAAERARFSRELHDSLLQGFSGVVYQLEAAARQFDTAPGVCKQRLERALNQADESLREARQMIVSMRIPALENSTLPEALRTAMAQIVPGSSVDFQIDINGRVRQGPYDVEANVFMIAREAVMNSLNHAEATWIRLGLSYTDKEICLTVEDDGVGFDPEAALVKPGHWGFRGMRERARHIRGAFSVETAPGRGARIAVAVPLKTESGARGS
jgi:ligand-binding sensor domain-containing protein/signal transduction histidine kinase